MLQTTPVLCPEGCPSGKKTLQRAEQDETRDSLQAEEPSPGLVWMITDIPALLHPSRVCSSLRLDMSTARQLPQAWCGSVETALQPSAAKWLPRATSRAALSWPCLSKHHPAASSLHTRGCGLQPPHISGPFPPRLSPTLSALPGLGGHSCDVWGPWWGEAEPA